MHLTVECPTEIANQKKDQSGSLCDVSRTNQSPQPVRWPAYDRLFSQILRFSEHCSFLVKNCPGLLQLVKIKRLRHHHVHTQFFVSANILVREMTRHDEDLAAKVLRP